MTTTPQPAPGPAPQPAPRGERGGTPTGWAPPPVTTVAETGLDTNYILTLALKLIHVYGLETPSQIAREIKLPVPMIRTILEGARERRLIESLGIPVPGGGDIRFQLAERGKAWVQEALAQSQYVGPAPVPLAAYQSQAERQRIVHDRTEPRQLAEILSALVIPDDLVMRLGPAVNSARSMLLYGPPGNGKSTIAVAMSKCFKQTIYVPYCIEVDGQIIKIFDPTVHVPVEPAPDTGQGNLSAMLRTAEVDTRWVRCHRPVAITGGELTLDMLDLRFNPIAKYYEAPMQVKTNGGVFVIDDFGRQLATPEQMLNRWIIPLENGYDFLTTANGKKFPVIFDGLVIFSTNLPPSRLMDSAMLRRIPYKFFLDPPTDEQFRRIYENVCRSHGLEPDHGLLDELLDGFFQPNDIELARFQPKFLLDHVVASCRFAGKTPRLDAELLFEAADHLYARQ